MKAINLTLRPVQLAPVNGTGRLGPAVDGAEDHERELVEVTDRETALAEAGTIALLDSAGRSRVKPKTEAERHAEAEAKATGGSD